LLLANYFAQGPQNLVVGAIHDEPGSVRSLARLQSQEKLGIQEFLAAVIQEQRIDAVAERKIHSCADESVLTICVKVAHANSPRPKLLDSNLVGNLLELAVSKVVVESIAEYEVAGRGA